MMAGSWELPAGRDVTLASLSGSNGMVISTTHSSQGLMPTKMRALHCLFGFTGRPDRGRARWRRMSRVNPDGTGTRDVIVDAHTGFGHGRQHHAVYLATWERPKG